MSHVDATCRLFPHQRSQLLHRFHPAIFGQYPFGRHLPSNVVYTNRCRNGLLSSHRGNVPVQSTSVAYGYLSFCRLSTGHVPPAAFVLHPFFPPLYRHNSETRLDDIPIYPVLHVLCRHFRFLHQISVQRNRSDTLASHTPIALALRPASCGHCREIILQAKKQTNRLSLRIWTSTTHNPSSYR